ncbi:ATP-dependent zinc protease family protein [Pseudovibrio exalbescens]|uniref:ATP-dependent zinc protease n=1 Tax=Pseudovibrio exalbescens TaxID=197461 RepID=A0A1U7JC75_9HYPH|nr:RimK/LysX family protein [Pseudovibrio exalbescens]OKL42294.1 ATP-dependent zinc protease [Pseudovibrio exalbescens]
MKTGSRSGPTKPDVIGWREYVALPDLGIPVIKAKVDTGARTSALNSRIEAFFEKDNARWVRFIIPRSSSHHRDLVVEAEVLDQRLIKNTSGIPEERVIIRSGLVLGWHHWHIEISLADRTNMGFDIILGRTSLKGRRVVINPARSFLAGQPQLNGNPASKAPTTSF